MDLSLCMIVKNEAEKLPRCLSSVKDVVDELIIVDTGSTDQTPEIARSFGAAVCHDMLRATGYSCWMQTRY
jgi:glycosyltransferase involved in cell wall biosynthesis